MRVFVYGTLTEPARVREVVDSYVFVGPAVLEGLRVVEGTHPTLAPPAAAGADDDPGAAGGPGAGDDPNPTGGPTARVGGRLLRTDDVAALDAYEGVDHGLYVRATVPLVDAAEADEVAVYVGDPARLGAPASWPGEGTFEARVRRYLDRGSVRVRRRPID